MSVSAPLPRPEPVETGRPDGVLVVHANAPDEACAQAIAQALVSEGLAACVNIAGPMQSVYRWRGEVVNATEVALVIKTAASRFPEMAARLKALHPHEVPEIMAVRPAMALPAYAAWVVAETRRPRA